MKKHENIILKVEKDSIAEELGIMPGDILLSVNGKAILDIFDYRYLIKDEYVELGIKSRDGEEYIAEIEKDEDEDIGIDFEKGLMDDAKSCQNKCIFCFIDQLPPGMRETLYFKDDDTRLSFLSGNYVTLTNMKDSDIDRIIYYHLSPINISVHTTDLCLRCKMLNNKKADKILKHMERLASAGLDMNLQIVLCRGINDQETLEKSIKDLSRFYPRAKSLSVVPVGITKYREGLYPLIPFDKKASAEVVSLIHRWQKKLKKEIGSAFVFAADEFYLKGKVPIPPCEAYEDFYQIENGVGMTALMEKEFSDCIEKIGENIYINREVSIATGTLAFDFINGLSLRLNQKFPNLKINLYAVENKFFGSEITVSGLLTGRDIIDALKDKPLGEFLLLPLNLLRRGENVLLDDIAIEDIEKSLKIPIKIADYSGKDFIYSIIDTEGKTCQNLL
ncbi:MAG: DUF512 domain-containing protein [Lachnospiraceae bacterium]|nr:DUF512 domain-containing protein [Lachnospiraceae bacterium]